MAAQVRANERADDDVLDPALAEVVERALNENVPKPLTLVTRVDLGVDEDELPVVAGRVANLARELVTKPKLVALVHGVVGYARLHTAKLGRGVSPIRRCEKKGTFASYGNGTKFDIRACQDQPILHAAGQLSYMGTKARIAPDVARVIRGHDPKVVIDPFAGMAAVASAFEDEAQLILSDSLQFVAHLARARFTGVTTPRIQVPSLRCDYRRHRRRLANSLGHRSANSIADAIRTTRRVSNDPRLRAEAVRLRQSTSGNRYQLATLYYADTYFSLEQCIEIDSIRYAIDRRPMKERGALVACFLIACSRCVNAPGHTAQYLRASNESSEKRVKAKWDRSIWDAFTAATDAFRQFGSAEWRRGNSVRCGDAPRVLSSLPEFDSAVVYMDPPYTKDHYSRFYHVYEELMLYRFPAVSGAGIYPDDRFASRFSIKSRAADAYRELFAEAARIAPWMVLSFPEQTFLGETEEVLLPLLSGTHGVKSISRVSHVHSTLGGSTGSAAVPVTELLVDCEAF